MLNIDPAHAVETIIAGLLLPILSALISHYRWPQWAKDATLSATAGVAAPILTHLQGLHSPWINLALLLGASHSFDGIARLFGVDVLERITSPTRLEFGEPAIPPSESLRSAPATYNWPSPPAASAPVAATPPATHPVAAPVGASASSAGPAPDANTSGEKTAVLIEELLAEAQRQRDGLVAQQQAAVAMQERLAGLLATQKGL